MIRTGYLRWEIDVQDIRSKDDPLSREVVFLARPGYRVIRVKRTSHADAAERFVRGDDTYESVLRTLERDGGETDVRVPDIGPLAFRYTESDRAGLPRYWMEKLQREVNAFAHEVVRTAASFPQLVISSPALRAGYARLVTWEIFRVIEGKSQPGTTEENEPMRLDATTYQEGVPELVAAELVRNVVEPKEFHEFCQFDCLTVLNGDKYYRIPAPASRPDRSLGRQNPPRLEPALRGLSGPGDAPVRRGRHEISARQAPAGSTLEGGDTLQSADRQVRGDAPQALDS